MAISKNTIIALLVLALLFALLFLNKCGNDPLPIPTVKTETKEIIKEVDRDSIQESKSRDSINKVNARLNYQLTEYKEDLTTAQDFVTELLNDAGQSIDTSSKDELKAQLEIVKQANVIKDSICNQTIRTQDSLNANISLQLAKKDTLYSKLRSSFNQVVENEQIKDKYISQLQKQARKKKASNVFWKITTAVAGAVIIKQSLK